MCSETGCKEEARHKFRSRGGMKVLLCDKHYKEWEKDAYKPPPLKMRLRTLWGQVRIFFGKAPGFMFSPMEAFKTVKDEDWTESIGYFVNFLIIFAILMAVTITTTLAVIWGVFESFFVLSSVEVLGLVLAPSIILPVEILAIIAISVIIGGLVGIFIESLWMHIWVYAVGGRAGVGQTVKAMVYGSTPALLLGWIPIINLIAMIWSPAVSIVGMKKLQEISTGRAVLAYILSVIMGYSWSSH